MQRPSILRAKTRIAMQRAYMKLRPLLESVAEIHPGDPAAAQFASFGLRSRIAPPQVALFNPAGVSIGADVYIRSHLIIEAYAEAGRIIIELRDGVQLGHYVRLVAFNGIVIEELVGIGHGCTIADSVHDWKSVNENEGRALWDTPAKMGRSLRICKGAWLGNNCVVAGGITIGEWSIVDPNTVITKDVPARTIVGGYPARVLRARRSDGTWHIFDDPPLLQDHRPENVAE